MTRTPLSFHLARLGGIGLSPVAPGSVATAVVGIPAACLLSLVPTIPALVILVMISITACYAAEKTALQLAKKDPSEVVIDELVGYLVTMIAIPVDFKSLVLGFLLFRLFDIWKPWPVSYCDSKIAGGIGIVMDDVAAGCCAHVLLRFALRMWS